MRTLKTLSLVLALVLCFGLVGTAFATGNFEGYTDAEKIGDAYTEAVDVMMGIGVIEGKTADTVDPTGNFTREQAAKIIAYMLMGKEAADKLAASAAPFADVAANRWSAGFIAFCADQKIVSGVGNGNFNPTGTLTGYQFAKMLLAAVGYNQNGEYEGASWSINVAKDAISLGIFDGDLSAATQQPIQRQQAILMAFNTLTAVNRVTYSELLKQYVSYGGGLLGAATTPVNLSANFQLNDYAAVDETGVTGRQWKVGTTNPKAVSDIYPTSEPAGSAKNAGALSGAALAKSYTFDAGTLKVLVNGVDKGATYSAKIKDTTDKAPLADFAGSSVEFRDQDGNGKIDTVVILQEFLAEVTKVDSKGTELTVYDKAGGTKGVVNANLSGLAKGDFILIVPGAGDFTKAPISCKKAAPTESGITAYDASSVTFNGAKQTYAANMFLEAHKAPNVYKFAPTTYNFYFNSNGVLIGEAVKGTAPVMSKDYILVVASASKAAVAGDLITSAQPAICKVQGVIADGTTKVFDVALDKTGKATVDGAGVAADGTAFEAAVPAGGLFAYTLADDGKIAALSSDCSVAAANINAEVLPVNGTITLTAGKAEIGFTSTKAPTEVKYATMGTKLTMAGARPAVYEGYGKFPAAATTYKVVAGKPAAAGECTGIEIVYAGKLITEIIITGAYEAAAPATTTTLVFTGSSEHRANAKGVDTEYFKFLAADGSTVEYPIKTGTVTAKHIYDVSIDDGIVTLKSDITAATTVAEKTDTFVVVGGNVFYITAKSVIFDVSGSAATWAAASFTKGDTVTIVADKDNNIVNAYITKHA